MRLFTGARHSTPATDAVGDHGPEAGHDRAPANPAGRWPWQRRPADEQPIWPDSNRWGTRLFLAVLLVAVLCGPLGLLVQLSRSHQDPAGTGGPTAPAGAVAAEQLLDRQRAAAAAAGFVEIWLTSSTDDTAMIAGLLAQPPKNLELPKTGADRVTAYPVQTSTVGQYQWNVVVRSQTGATVAWWLVDVMVVDHTALIMTVPGQIPPPAGPAALDVDDLHQLSTDHPAAETAAAFLNAMLTGTDTTRWTRPDSALAPLPSSACSKTATDVATPVADPPVRPDTGDTLLVMASTRCSSTIHQYGLDLRGRDGRWEVAGMTTPSHVMAARPQPTATPSRDSTTSHGPSTEPATPRNTDR